MSFLEKTILQNTNTSKIVLYKEGIFYKAYNEGAFLLRDKNYKVSVQKFKNIEKEVLSREYYEKRLKFYSICYKRLKSLDFMYVGSFAFMLISLY